MTLDKGWGLIPEASWRRLNLLYLLVGESVKRQIGGAQKSGYENELQQVLWADGRAPKLKYSPSGPASSHALLPANATVHKKPSENKTFTSLRHLASLVMDVFGCMTKYFGIT